MQYFMVLFWVQCWFKPHLPYWFTLVVGLGFLGFCPKLGGQEIECLLGLFASILLHGEWRNFALHWVPTMLLDHEPKKEVHRKMHK